MQNSLNNDNAALNMIIENFPDLIYWKDKNLTYQGCNKNVSNILGYKTPSDIIGKTDLDLAQELNWNSDKIKKIDETDKLIIKNGVEISEEEAISFHGVTKIYTTNKKPLYKNGEIIGILGISTDITDRKSMEEDLKAAKEKNEIYIHGIVENLPQLVYWKDKDFIYQGCNNLCAEVLNLETPAQIVGKSDNDFGWSSERIEELHNIDRKILKNGTPQVVEDIIPIKKNNRIFLTSKTPLIDKDGSIVGILGISTDISDMKKMEEDLKAAKIAAEVGEQTKTEFIANISHDIRTPLAGLVGLAHQVEEETTEPHQKDLITQIANCGDALFKMFVEILDNITAEHMTEKDLEIETFDLNSLAKEISELKKPSLTHKGLEFITSIDPKIPSFLVGDRRKIHRIILNLLGNAIKFTKQGHVEFKIELVEKLPDKAILKFNIIDTGIGVPLESKSRLFERFYKASPSYKGEYKGFGLGLHIAETYTHLLDGTISFESTEGIGSNFYATIPLKIANEHEIEIYKQKLAEEKPSLLKINKNLNPELIIEKPKESKPIDLKIPENTLHILVIEDNPAVRILTINFIKKVNLKYTEAGDGETALELAKNQHFDLILADVGLPGISGTDFTKQLRLFEKEHNKQLIPIVGVTAHATTGRDECLSAGMNAVTPKPLSFATFKEILQNFLPTLKI